MTGLNTPASPAETFLSLQNKLYTDSPTERKENVCSQATHKESSCIISSSFFSFLSLLVLVIKKRKSTRQRPRALRPCTGLDSFSPRLIFSPVTLQLTAGGRPEARLTTIRTGSLSQLQMLSLGFKAVNDINELLKRKKRVEISFHFK